MSDKVGRTLGIPTLYPESEEGNIFASQEMQIALSTEPGLEEPLAKRVELVGQQVMSEIIDLKSQVLSGATDLTHVESFSSKGHIFLETAFQASKIENNIFIEHTIQRIEQVLYVLSSLAKETPVDNVRETLSALRSAQYVASSRNYEELNQAIVIMRNQIADALKDLDQNLLKTIKRYFYNTYICPPTQEREKVLLKECRNAMRLATVKNKLRLGTAFNLPKIVAVLVELGLFEEAIAFEEKIPEGGFDKDLALHSVAVGLAKAGQCDKAKSFALRSSSEMKESTLETIAKEFSQAGLFDQAFDVALSWDREADGTPKRVDCALLPIVSELTRAGLLGEAMSIAHSMDNSSKSKSFAFASIVNELVDAGRCHEARIFLKQISASISMVGAIRFDALGSIVRGLIKEDQLDEALTVIQEGFALSVDGGADIKDELALLGLVVEAQIKANRVKEVHELIDNALRCDTDSYEQLRPYLNKALAWIVDTFTQTGHLEEATGFAEKISDYSEEQEIAFSVIVKKMVEADRLIEAIEIAEKRTTTFALRQIGVEMARKGLFTEALSLVKEKIHFGSDALCVRGWVAIEMARAGHFERALADARFVVKGMDEVYDWRLDEQAFAAPDWWKGPVVEEGSGVVTRWLVTDLLGRIVEEMIKARRYDYAYASLKEISEKDCKSKIDLLNTIAVELVKLGRLSDAYVVAEEISDTSDKAETYMELVVELTKAGRFDEARVVVEKDLQAFPVPRISDLW